MPFTTREEITAGAWKPKPTALPSAAISEAWSQKIRNEAVFGARITQRAYLDAIKKNLVDIIGGTITPQEAERRLKDTLRNLGYSPERGFGDGKVPPASAGDIRDLSSSRRIQLIIDTNVKRARSMGQVAASENPVSIMATPAWKLTRTGARKKPRGNWKRRWAEAGAKCGWNGAAKNVMVALKSSPIWQALADGAGGFTDTLGSPFPPFAFGSGMAWVGVGRREWKRICAAEGIDDGLEEVAQRAREMKYTAPQPTAPQKIDITLPALGDNPKGVSNPLTEPLATRPIMPVKPIAVYEADYSARNRANAAIDNALSAVNLYLKDVERWVEEEAGTEDSILLYDAVRELRSLKGRVTNYGGSIETTPKPRNRIEQTVYDTTMERIARAAEATAKTAKRVYAKTKAIGF